jgi:hypothetical protein
MGINDLLAVDLTDDEIRVLRHGLLEWGGPARCTDRMALAMGFESVDDILRQGDRIRTALDDRQPMSQRDWVRALLATEVVFASDVLGSGQDWESTSGLTDAETIRVLRSLQRKVPKAGFSLDVLLRTDRSA